jgi:probable F420-dependent oxidoreductase
MRYGVTIFATDTSIDIVEVAQAAEERGFDSLWVPEHTHIPTSRVSPWPGGGDLPEEYWHCLDPFVALTAAAVSTKHLRVGTGILLAAQHDPIAAAKAVATLDHLSGGRVTVGVGYGWNVEEMNDHGVEFRDRRARVREHVLAMQALWRDDEASFDGEFVSFPPSWSWPKPVQRDGAGATRVPVVVGGGAGPKLFEAIAEYGDGWIPIGGAGLTKAIPQLHEAMAAAGRDPADVEVIPFGTFPDGGKLDHYAEIGVAEVVCALPSAPRDQVLPWLDKITEVVAAHRGA